MRTEVAVLHPFCLEVGTPMAREEVVHAQSEHRIPYASREKGSTEILRFIIRYIVAHAKPEVDFGGTFIYEVVIGMNCE